MTPDAFAEQIDIDQILEGQSADMWECIKEDANAILATDPENETARVQLLKYLNFRHQQNHKPEGGAGLVLIKKNVTRRRRVQHG